MSRQLKQDLFGRVLLEDDATHGAVVVRELRESRPWLRWLARHLARREVRALRLLRQLHARGVVHNDLAKEPNWIVTPTGEPALVDFQLALCRDRSTRLFRILAHDDLRHLLKHKRTYAAQRLTARQKRVLATPSIVTRIWMNTGKRLYRFITRRVLHWSDREGAGDRQL